MVIGRVFRDVACKLRNFGVGLHVALECGPHDLPLDRLETIHHTRDCTNDIILSELHQLLLHEIRVADRVLGVVHILFIICLVDPLLSVVSPFFVEGHVEVLIIITASIVEREHVVFDVAEILFCFCSSRCAQAFVVLQMPATAVVVGFFPLLVFLHREEVMRLVAPADFDNGSYELREESWKLEERRPPVLHQVENETFNVGAIIILVCHDHDGSIP
mmetsp:Transcript_75508/g.133279  ORF Transcript_75508/g.133279 Transcript_75508/m.133279 type:complete len:218 (-) Transcript_75508:1594-2247(-)